MLIDIYQFKTTKSFVSVKAGMDISKVTLPINSTDLILFKKNVEIDPNTPRVAMDIKDIIKQITDNGYALHGVQINFNE